MKTDIKLENGQKLTLCLEVVSKDFIGVFNITALINQKRYDFVLGSEYKVRRVQELIRKRRPGKALKILREENINKRMWEDEDE